MTLSNQNRLISNQIKGEEDGHHDDIHFHIHFLLWNSDFGFHFGLGSTVAWIKSLSMTIALRT